MDCLQWESVVALGLLLTSVFVSIIIILILPDYHRIDGAEEVCVQLKGSVTCGKTEDKLHQYLDEVCYAFWHYELFSSTEHEVLSDLLWSFNVRRPCVRASVRPF